MVLTTKFRKVGKKIEVIAYPSWVCEPCGMEHGSGKRAAVSSWHYGKCEVCGKNANVTEPRDFGHFKKWFEGCL